MLSLYYASVPNFCTRGKGCTNGSRGIGGLASQHGRYEGRGTGIKVVPGRISPIVNRVPRMSPSVLLRPGSILSAPTGDSRTLNAGLGSVGERQFERER
jgi:hypothetical protein